MSTKRLDRPLPTFAARETFFATDKTGPGAAISLAGVPFDIATTNRAGARDGPAAIRRASRMCGGAYPDNWADMYDLDFADVGNFSILMGDLDESLKMIENERSTAINPADAVEEKVSLSDRFGLWLGFHGCSQEIYLDMIAGYAAHYGLQCNPEDMRAQAIEWSITRGARSGRVAWQFIQDLAGRLGVTL